MMHYLPILQELFESDSILFLLIGLALAGILSLYAKAGKKRLSGMLISLLVYALCEALSHIRGSYMLELVLLFAGTIAIGAFIGFAIALLSAKLKKR